MLAEASAESPLLFNGDGWCVLDHDPITGRTTEALIDGTKMHVRVSAPADAIVEQNHAEQVDNLNRPFGDMAKVASVPMHIWANRLLPAIQQGDDKFLSKWLNNPDHAKFRTRTGLV